MGTDLFNEDVRAVARRLWAAQDAFLAGGPPPLHAEREIEVLTRPEVPPAALAARTAVVSAETWTWRPHGTVTELVVETTLEGPDGMRVALGRATVVLGPSTWSAALAS